MVTMMSRCGMQTGKCLLLCPKLQLFATADRLKTYHM
jgi:hypothetical protein